jgi:hypothetical protein
MARVAEADSGELLRSTAAPASEGEDGALPLLAVKKLSPALLRGLITLNLRSSDATVAATISATVSP